MNAHLAKSSLWSPRSSFFLWSNKARTTHPIPEAHLCAKKNGHEIIIRNYYKYVRKLNPVKRNNNLQNRKQFEIKPREKKQKETKQRKTNRKKTKNKTK
jgi:hypothetical protein